MRLSGLVIAVILLFSTTLVAQHSSGGGGSSSGGHSGGSSSSGSSHSSSSSSGSYSSSSSSHVGSAGSTRSSPSSGSASSSVRTDRAKADSSGSRPSKESAQIDARPGPDARPGSDVRARGPESPSGVKPEKKSFVSFLRHPFKKSKPVAPAKFKRPPCRKEPCAVCPPGSRHGRGGCVSPVIANECQAGQVWNGFGCGTQAWFNDCRALSLRRCSSRCKGKSTLA